MKGKAYPRERINYLSDELMKAYGNLYSVFTKDIGNYNLYALFDKDKVAIAAENLISVAKQIKSLKPEKIL